MGSTIDQYNDTITGASPIPAGLAGTGTCWMSLECRPAHLPAIRGRRGGRPPWWRPYPLPPELAALRPVPDSRFLTSDSTGRRSGGLFSLDGIHPTTVGYGIILRS